MADVETTVTPVPLVLVRSNLNLLAASNGVVLDTSSSISGAQTTLDFQGCVIKRFTVTGDLSGSYTFPPSNIPELAADGQSVILSIFYFQDATGGHSIPLSTLFSNAQPNVLGEFITDESPGGVTVVDIVARRAGGVTTYTVNLAPTFDAGQITSGVLTAAVLPVATDALAGVVTLSPGSGGAAKGDHTHAITLCGRITLEMSNGGAITNGDYTLIDVPTSGTVVRLTGLQLFGGTNPVATVSAKISGTTVTGTGTNVVSTSASADANATAANTFVARQLLQVNVASVAGSPTLLSGYLHYTLTTQPWSV